MKWFIASTLMLFSVASFAYNVSDDLVNILGQYTAFGCTGYLTKFNDKKIEIHLKQYSEGEDATLWLTAEPGDGTPTVNGYIFDIYDLKNINKGIVKSVSRGDWGPIYYTRDITFKEVNEIDTLELVNTIDSDKYTETISTTATGLQYKNITSKWGWLVTQTVGCNFKRN